MKHTSNVAPIWLRVQRSALVYVLWSVISLVIVSASVMVYISTDNRVQSIFWLPLISLVPLWWLLTQWPSDIGYLKGEWVLARQGDRLNTELITLKGDIRVTEYVIAMSIRPSSWRWGSIWILMFASSQRRAHRHMRVLLRHGRQFTS